MNFNSKVKKWLNSLGVRINKAIADKAQISENTEVDIAVSGNRLILTPLSPRYTIEDLIAGVTDENTHGEVNAGPSVGMEAW